VGSFTAFHVVIHGLERDFSWPGKPIPADLTGAGENSCGELLKHGLHLNSAILVDPAARLNIDSLARRERDLKDVAITVKPENAFLGGAGKRIDEKPSASEKDIGRATYSGKSVFNVIGRGEPLVFADIDAGAALQVQSKYMTRTVSAEGNAARPLAPVSRKGIPASIRLKAPFKGWSSIWTAGSFQSRM